MRGERVSHVSVLRAPRRLIPLICESLRVWQYTTLPPGVGDVIPDTNIVLRRQTETDRAAIPPRHAGVDCKELLQIICQTCLSWGCSLMSRSSSADSGGVVDRQQEEPGPVFLYLDGRYESQDCRPLKSQGQDQHWQELHLNTPSPSFSYSCDLLLSTPATRPRSLQRVEWELSDIWPAVQDRLSVCWLLSSSLWS